MLRCSPILLTIIAGGTASVSSAQLLNWTNISGGAASISGNWSPAAVPGAANTLQFNLANTYGITFNSSTTASLGHVYKRGTVNLTISTPHTAGASGIIVGDTSGDAATTVLNSGSLSTPGNVVVADDSGSTGTLNLITQAASLTTTGTGQLIVGRNGAAAMNQTGFSTTTIAGNLIVGENNTSTSIATISGASSIIPFPRSTLNINGATASRIGSGGDATLTISSGGRANFSSDLIVANGSASTSAINVQGVNILNTPSSLSIGGNLNLGRNLSAGTAAGDGTLNVDDGGSVDVDGTLFVAGDTLGGTGAVNISGQASLVTCTNFDIGAGGTLSHTSGTLRIDGGAFTFAPTASFNFNGGSLPSSPATTILSNGATYQTSSPTQLGSSANALIRIESGSTWSHPGAVFTLAASAPGNARTIVDGNGSVLHSIALLIGSGGTGALEATNLGSIITRGVELARLPGSSGTWTLNNGRADIENSIFIGGSTTTPGGAGTLTLANGSIVTADEVVVHAGTGSLNVISSTLTIANHLTLNNPATFTNATVQALQLDVDAPLSASGAITAGVEFGTAAITANGPLTINSPGAPNFNSTPLNVGPHTVSINDGGPIFLGNTTMLGGTLNLQPSARVSTGVSLSGTGTINTVLTCQGGTINPGGPNGLLINGSLVLTSGAISGTLIDIGENSSYNGVGTVNAAFNARLGSTINVNGTSSLGINAPNGFASFGHLNLSGNLTILDSNGFNLGALVTLNGGTLHSNAVATLGQPSLACMLRGSGTMNAELANFGTISPGIESADRTAAITMNRLFENRAAPNLIGTLAIQIEGLNPGQFDSITCNSFATLDGAVILSHLNGFLPVNGDRISFITSPREITGQFATLTAPRGWHIEYFQTHTDAVFCSADFNSDGVIDFFDYLDFVAAFSANDADADFNFDFVIDFFDYLDFVAAFSTGC